MTYLLAGLAVAVLAAAWHAVTEHHAHLHHFWRYVRPDAYIPPARHDTCWHGAGHRFRYVILVALAAAAFLSGLGFTLQPRIAAAAVIVTTVLGTVALAARTLARRLGERHRPYPDHLED